MRWITKEEVRKAARVGRREALLCSIRHWVQLTVATPDQLQYAKKKYSSGIIGGCNIIRSGYCALCTRYNFDQRHTQACKSCRLDCLPLWRVASEAWNRRDWVVWYIVAGKVLEKLKKLYRKEYGRIPRGTLDC